jgi:hypothetical protein
MLTFAEARAVAVAYAKAHSATWFDDKPVIEREAYWYFPVGSIGSSGLAVDKQTGRVEPFGSSLSLEDDLWTYEHGFMRKVGLRVTRVHDLDRTVELFLYLYGDGPKRTPNPNARRSWLRERLSSLPCEWPPQWFPPLNMKKGIEGQWFEYELVSDSTDAS